MLTGKQKAELEGFFTGEGLTELSIQQSRELASQIKIPLGAVESFALEKGIFPSRYERNKGSIGIEGQKKLLKSKVIVVGLGGLGGYVTEALGRLGTGQIVGVDSGIFDETNLNRQIFAKEDNLVEKKAEEAGKRLEEVNHAVVFTGIASSFDKLDDEIWNDADLVFDCLDNISDRLGLAATCSDAKVPLIHGAIAGWYGQVAVIWPETTMLEKIYKNQKFGIEQNIGTPVFTAAAAASLMTAEGVKILTGKNLKREQKMLFFDLLEDEWQTIRFQ